MKLLYVASYHDLHLNMIANSRLPSHAFVSNDLVKPDAAVQWILNSKQSTYNASENKAYYNSKHKSSSTYLVIKELHV